MNLPKKKYIGKKLLQLGNLNFLWFGMLIKPISLINLL